jgi:hypothetical protein
MVEGHLIDIPVGTTVRSCHRAPIDGIYEFVEHIHSRNCTPAAGDVTTYCWRGQLLPICKSCGQRCIWKLMETKFDIPADKDVTSYVLKEVRGDRSDVLYPSGTKRQATRRPQ